MLTEAATRFGVACTLPPQERANVRAVGAMTAVWPCLTTKTFLNVFMHHCKPNAALRQAKPGRTGRTRAADPRSLGQKSTAHNRTSHPGTEAAGHE